MTIDEIKKYICQIALSGALDFIEKYEGKDASGGIIGHFGLGFYSAFMVADTVDVISRSYTGAPAVKWTCEDAGSYESCSRSLSALSNVINDVVSVDAEHHSGSDSPILDLFTVQVEIVGAYVRVDEAVTGILQR